MQKSLGGSGRREGGGGPFGGVRFGEGVGEQRSEVIVKCKTKLGGGGVSGRGGGGGVRVDMNEELKLL